MIGYSFGLITFWKVQRSTKIESLNEFNFSKDYNDQTLEEPFKTTFKKMSGTRY